MTQKDASVGDWVKNLPLILSVLFFAFTLSIFLFVMLDTFLSCHFKEIHFTSVFKTLHQRYLYLIGLILGSPPQRLQLISNRLMISCFIFVCGYWLLGIIMTSVIQTNLVLLDLSDISDNLQHLIKTKRMPCWIKGEKYLTNFENASPGTVFHKLWNWKSKDKCFFDKDLKHIVQVFKIRNGAIIGDEMYM